MHCKRRTRIIPTSQFSTSLAGKIKLDFLNLLLSFHQIFVVCGECQSRRSTMTDSKSLDLIQVSGYCSDFGAQDIGVSVDY